MDKVLVGLLAETLLKSGIEAMMKFRQMDTEGREQTTPEEDVELQNATDAAAKIAREKGDAL